MLTDPKRKTRTRIIRKLTMIERDFDKVLKHLKDLEEMYEGYEKNQEWVKNLAKLVIELQDIVITYRTSHA